MMLRDTERNEATRERFPFSAARARRDPGRADRGFPSHHACANYMRYRFLGLTPTNETQEPGRRRVGSMPTNKKQRSHSRGQ
jgi:hypothetical protein